MSILRLRRRNRHNNKTGSAQSQLKNCSVGAWKFRDQYRQARCKTSWDFANQILMLVCLVWRAKALFSAENFIRLQPSRNGAIADCSREFIDCRLIAFARSL